MNSNNVKLNALYLVDSYPFNPGDREGSFIFDSIQAASSEGIRVSVILVTPIKFKLSNIKHWVMNKNDSAGNVMSKLHSNFIKVNILSIPRQHCFSFSCWLARKIIFPYISSLSKIEDFSIIHAHSPKLSTVALYASNYLKIPYCITSHGVSTKRTFRQADGTKTSNIYKNSLYLKSLKNASTIFIVGNKLRGLISSSVNATSNIMLLPNGINPKKTILKKDGYFSSDIVKIISVGNLHVQKGVDLNIRALYQLKERGICNWHYTIVGDGLSKETIKDLVMELELSDYISFVGYCSHDAVYKYLDNNDVFCLPSYDEAFGIVYIEAMSRRLLTIGVRGQGPSQYIEHGVTGFLVEPRSVNSIFRVLEDIITKKVDVKKIASDGCDYVLNNLQWSHHAYKLKQSYKLILSSSEGL